MDKCIYCSKSFDSSRGSGDHIIPSQLGEFRSDVRFRRICTNCNNRIGHSEQQLVQCAPEAWFRRIVQPASPPSRKRGRSPVGAQGAPPPRNTIAYDDHHVLVETDREDVGNVYPCAQIVLQDEDGKEDHIRLFPGMTTEDLRRKIDKSDIKPATRAWLHCDKDQWDHYCSLVRTISPKSAIENLPDTPPGSHRVRGRIAFTVTDHYFRAVTKIGFHYYLAHTRRRLKGNEPCFEPLRRFIMEGGQHEPFVSEGIIRFDDSRLHLWFNRLVSPIGWCHILAMDERSHLLMAYVQLFRASQSGFPGYKIQLGSPDTQIDLPTFRRGHVYAYDSVQPKTGFAGEVHEFPDLVVPLLS